MNRQIRGDQNQSYHFAKKAFSVLMLPSAKDIVHSSLNLIHEFCESDITIWLCDSILISRPNLTIIRDRDTLAIPEGTIDLDRLDIGWFNQAWESGFLIGWKYSNSEMVFCYKSVQLEEQKTELLKTFLQTLVYAVSKQRNIERKKFLELWADESSDALQVAYEDGHLFYINKTAENRLGISLEECSQYQVFEFEELFSNKEEWDQHVEEIKEKGILKIEGENKNLKTGEYIPVEVTVRFIPWRRQGLIVAQSRDISERKRAKQELTETQGRIESILNEISDVVWSASLPNYELIFATPSAIKLFGEPLKTWYSNESWWHRAIAPQDYDHTIDFIKKQLEEKGKYVVKHRVLTHSGEVKWVRNEGKWIYDEKGDPVRLDGVLKERTSQYLAEKSLQRQVLLQEILIDIANTYINLDLTNVDSTINQSLKKLGELVKADRVYIFDYDFPNEIANNTYEWCQRGIEPQIKNLKDVPLSMFPDWVKAHKSGEAYVVPNVGALDEEKHGGLKQILEAQDIKSTISIPLMHKGSPLGFVGFDSVVSYQDYSREVRDLLFLFAQMLINVRIRQGWERQIRLQEEKYRNIIANMNLGLIEVDNNDVIQYANHSFCQISGYDIDEIMGKKASNMFIPEDKYETIYKKTKRREQGESDTYEIQAVNKKGENRWWFISGAPNYDDQGNLIGSVGIHLDITEQKRMEKELEKAKLLAEAAASAKELFLANMSHEIRTPLNVIIGMIRELNRQDLSSKQRVFISNSEVAAKHLLNIINNILDMAKIESGEVEIQNAPFSLKKLVGNITQMMEVQAQDKDVDFESVIDPKLNEFLLGDEVRMRQVLLNLLGNAIKFTDEGSITLELSVVEDIETAQRIRIDVRDTGIGMSDNFIAQIFDKFSQEETAATRKFDGTGLGMAISRDLVSLMGGELNVESAKNAGTHFSFEVVMSKTSHEEDHKQIANSGSHLDNYTPHILLVEDNEMNRFIALQTLKQIGANIVEAGNGKEAIQIIKDEEFDLILMDIQMPEMDGVQATKIIRRDLGLDVPIIALTANAFKHDIEQYLAHGMNDYITKPYDEADFLKKVRQFLSQRIKS
jgi:PAS domain S-box-containing protein